MLCANHRSRRPRRLAPLRAAAGLARMATVAALLFAAAAPSGAAQSLDEVEAEGEARLDDALQRLRELRQSIQKEKLPLEQKLNRLNAKADELKEKVERARRLKDDRSVELDELRSRVNEREKTLDYILGTLVPEYVSDYDSSLSPGERAGEPGASVRAFNRAAEDPGTSREAELDRALALIEDSFGQLRSLFGGKRYAGEALAPGQRVRDGRFLQLGPLLYFAPEGDERAGMVRETSDLRARLHPLSERRSAAIRATARAGEGTLPTDPTLGDALDVEATEGTLVEHLKKGGVWVYPILFFAVVAAGVGVAKAIQVYRVRHPRPGAIHAIVERVRGGDARGARELAAAQPAPARDMLVAAVEHADESIEMVEEVMYESMLSAQPRFESFLNVIAVTASAAPLLGLLGTVTGIINTFRLMTVFGAGDPEPLMSGISEALITTELGLILAIPALVLHALLSRRVAGIMSRMEKAMVTFVNGLSRGRSAGQAAEDPGEDTRHDSA